MNTTQLKKFAAEARTILKEGVILRLEALGFKPDGSVSEEDQPTKGQGFVLFRGEALPDDGFFEKWQSLYNRVQLKGIQEVYEEAAYTWFNRLTAIRIMAKNGFIAPVLEYVSESTRIPVILSQAREGQFPEMSAAEREQLMAIIDDGRKSQEQFAILITAYCHANPVINKCFGGVTDYTTLLLPQNIIAEGGFIDLLNNAPFIDDEDYKSAELIGWLYQFYISEKKDDVFASFKAGKKAEAEDIPAATQIFTPNWIVKYMVQNTLGRIYLDNNPFDTDMKEKMLYLVEPSEPTPEEAKFKYESLEDLRLGDLACGSGHILNEFFDLMYLFYIEDGYSRRNAIENIFLKNLTGIDLDTRAKQLAQFALLVKASQKDPSFLDAAVMPNVLDMPAPLDINFVKQTLPEFFLGGNAKMLQETEDAFELLQQAENLGSIMKFNISDSTRAAIEIRMKEWEAQPAETVSDGIKALLHSFRLILALTQKYSALVMNPPYMGSGNMNDYLKKYVNKNYEDGKADLFSVFMIVAIEKISQNAKYGMINMHSWMFLSSFEKLRVSILDEYTINSLLHLGTRTFDELSGEVVQNASFVISKSKNATNGIYFRLLDGRNCGEKEKLFVESIHYHNDSRYFSGISPQKLKIIPGSPIAYWISDKTRNAFLNPKLDLYGKTTKGIITGDNSQFIRNWHEISKKNILFGVNCIEEAISSKYKWFPCNKGGGQRKWYGNNDYIIDWENDGQRVLLNAQSENRHSQDYYSYMKFRPIISWSSISSSFTSFRYKNHDLVEHAGMGYYVKDEDKIYNFLGFLSSKVSANFLNIISPTLNVNAGEIESLPFIDKCLSDSIKSLVISNVYIAQQDWDAHETSWDFQRNELVSIAYDFINSPLECVFIDQNGQMGSYSSNSNKSLKIEDVFEQYIVKWQDAFVDLHNNEEELNKQFIDIYGLQDELSPEVPFEEITILQQGELSIVDGAFKWHKDEIMKQLISYAIGCWMGRYRLDKPGLYIAHPDAKPEEIITYEYNGQSFEIDDDGIIPLLPAYASFPDNGYKRIQDFVRIAFGAETLTENINFIEEALGMSLEKFMVKDFWKYHKKMYQNRPIYWLFSSKKGAFQCLTYMHRMNAYTAEQVRSKYLLPHIEWLKNHIAEMEARASQLTTQERRQKDQMAKDLKECLEYHDELHVVADHNISFDLDDGVVKNYALFGNVLAKLK